jgi:lysophospholipase L1-like esterase
LHALIRVAAGGLLCWCVAGCRGLSASRETATTTERRIVFLGDSITDGFTYALLVKQALELAGEEVPRCYNAGVGGDSAARAAARLERDAFVFAPTDIVLNVGHNDAFRNVTPEAFGAEIRTILEAATARGIRVLVLTCAAFGPANSSAENRIAEFNAELRQLAAEFGCPVAPVNRMMREALRGGAKLHEPDDVLPNFEGCRIIARAVLQGMGFEQAAVPATLKLEPLPGIVSAWKLKALAPTVSALSAGDIERLVPDITWVEVVVPERGRADTWWLDQERQRGVVTSVGRKVGGGTRYVGIGEVVGKQPGQGWLNTGGYLEEVWLNGKRVFRQEGWTGLHPGKERVPVRLRAGTNSVVIVTGPQFFVSFTEDADW